jgi:SAM-dependent methyltransferase
VYHVLGRVQALAATFANLGRSVPREYRRYDVSKLLRAQRVARRLEEGEEVLDVGCGDGLLLCDLALFRSLKRRVGIDVELPRPPEPEIEVAAYNGQSLPFPDSSFDSVIFGYFLHYLTRDHVLRLLKDGCRVARRNLFVLDDAQPEWSFCYRIRNRLERLRSDILYRAVSGELYQGAGNEEMYLTYDGWRALLKELSGVVSVEVEPLDRISGLVHHTLFHVRLRPAVTSPVE